MKNYTQSTSNLSPLYNYAELVTAIVIDEGVTSIGDSAFFIYKTYTSSHPWSKLESVSLPSTLTKIGNYGLYFYGLNNPIDIFIPDGVTSIGTYAFQNSLFSSITIPASVTTIGNYSFRGCSNLKSVYVLGTTPASEGTSMFTGCSAELSIYVPGGCVDAYKAAWPEYSAYIVGSDGGDGSGGSATDGTDYYSLWVKHEDKAGYYWGSTCQFYADWNYTGDGVFDRSVTWSVSGSDSQTAISDGGLLTIGPNETQLYLTITATSVAFPSLSSTSTIRITQSTEPEDGGSSGDGSGSSGIGGDYAAEFDELDEGINNLQTAVDDVGSAVETLPGSITSGMQDIMDQQQSAAESQGQESVDQIIEIIPNESQGFIDALGSLVNALSYNGTDAILTVPAIKIPAVGNLFPETVLCAEQKINFGDYFAKIPENLLMLVRALFDAALVGYCLKELISLIGNFATGFKDVNYLQE